MNILSRLHIFTEIIYVPVPHVKYCTRFIMLTSSWLACNKMWYCEKAHWFCNYFIICHEDHHHLLGFRYVVCLLFMTKYFRRTYWNEESILCQQIFNYFIYTVTIYISICELLSSAVDWKKKVLFSMANVYQRPPIRVCLKYLCADLI